MREKSSTKVVIKTRGTYYLIPAEEILFCEEKAGRIRFHTRNHGLIPASGTINNYEPRLLPKGFFRTHEKYLVNLRHIIGFENDPNSVFLMDFDHSIPIESRRELELLEKMNRMAKSKSC